ncbi:uncharacterized protein Dwil_GK28160 [Drosophila willistoni]|uniref:Uncharacterized protein n=1 Tax=Drosophila willistoni TaxID=7260 RepID=A0A0Q9WQT2_DROWI|nr:uncharacterized protein LOC26530162 [Drosophila willistoni]KRF97715.1 uncharacterized protein Dwil_GK28160 [Drosophila willistoni]
MPVRLQRALLQQQNQNRINIKWIIVCSSLLLLLIVLNGIPTTDAYVSSKNCSFVEGHILEFACQGVYDRELRLLHKDRHPAIGTPYVVWQRSDYMGSAILLIAFYESPLFNCYNLVYDDDKFYCDGLNYPLEFDSPISTHCLSFHFKYAEALYKKCIGVRKTHIRTISAAVIYMNSNVVVESKTGQGLKGSGHLVLMLITLLGIVWRLYM